MNDIELKRQAVAGAYPSFTWKTKVKLMSDNQIIAVYLRLKSKNKI